MKRWDGLPFVALVLLQLERVVTMVVFVDVALVEKLFWIVITPLWSKWLCDAPGF
jgi:hypothetical protein